MTNVQYSINDSKNVEELIGILTKSLLINSALDLTLRLNLQDWYIAAGAISQTVWNYMHGFELDEHIRDIDLVYFDPDTSYDAEDKFVQLSEKLFADLPVEIEIRNQARVHMWFHDHFGKEILPYKSTQEAIASWLTIPTCVGITLNEHDQIEVYSPYGLDDLLDMIVRPNLSRGIDSKPSYIEKTDRWKKVWPKLTIVPWDEA